jgi:hypothetical protein
MTVAARIAGLRRLHDRWTADLQQLQFANASLLAKALIELEIVIQELEYSNPTERADSDAVTTKATRYDTRTI